MMKQIGIEDLLGWAYRQELPKARREGGGFAPAVSNWSVMATYAELLTTIDAGSNLWGCVPILGSGEEEPHPDAILVGQAVEALADVSFDLPIGFDVLGGMPVRDEGAAASLAPGGLSDAERADCHARGLAIAQVQSGRLPGVIIRLAILQRRPSLGDHGAVVRKAEIGANGKPRWYRLVTQSAGEGRAPYVVEMDGYDRRRQKRHDDAYRKTHLVPDPARLAAERIEWQAWVMALELLADELDGRISGWRIKRSGMPLAPWEGGEGERAPRILEILREKQGARKKTTESA